MATNSSKPYSTYVMGTQNFTVQPGTFMPMEGTPAGAQNMFYSTVGGWQGQQTITATTTATPQTLPGQSFVEYYTRMLHEQQEAQQRLMNHLMDALRYGHGAHQTNWEEPKALETKPLSDADRSDLERSLPF
jgi:hypothetical protein